MRRCRCALHGLLRYPVGDGSPLTLGDTLLPLIPCNEIFYDPPKLRARLDEEGYLYFKSVIPRAIHSAAFDDLAAQMLACQWTTEAAYDHQRTHCGLTLGVPYPRVSHPHTKQQSAHSPGNSGGVHKEDYHDNAIRDDDNNTHTGESAASSGMSATYELPPAHIRYTDTIRQAVSGTSAMAVVRQVFSGAVHAATVQTLHLGAPREHFGFRMPSVYHNQGTKLALVALVPLHDVPMYMGTPVLVRGSNSGTCYAAVRQSYGQHEVESGDIAGDGCFTTASEELLGRGRQMQPDAVTGRPTEVDVHPMVSCALEAGDLLLMTVYTMYAYLTNQTNCWRMMAEAVWTMEGDSVGPDPRYVGPGATGLSRWYATREDAVRYPRTMTEAKRAWGLLRDE